MRPRDTRPPAFVPAAYAIGEIDHTATEDTAKWVLGETVHKLLENVADPRAGEITVTYYDGVLPEFRAIWNPNRQ